MNLDLIAAQAAVERQDYTLAHRNLQAYLQRAQYDGRGWELFGLVLSVLDDHRASVASLERASLLVPMRPEARIALAIGYGKIGRIELSRELLEEIIDDHATLSAEQIVQVAVGLDAVGNSELAMQACRKAAELDPLLAQPYYDLGYYSAKCGRPLEFTISLARKAISLDPSNVTYRVGLASLLMKVSGNDDAYQVVKDLSDTQIISISCSCCLERIVSVFAFSGDRHRAALSRERLLELTATAPTSTDTEEESS